MTSQELINSGKLELYVLGELDEKDAMEVEIASASSPDVNEEIRILQNALRKYVMSFEKTPPLGYKRQVLELLAQKMEVKPEKSEEKEKTKAAEEQVVSEKKSASALLLPVFIITTVLSITALSYFAFKTYELNKELGRFSASISLEKESSLQANTSLIHDLDSLNIKFAIVSESFDVIRDSAYSRIILTSPDGINNVNLYWNRDDGKTFVDASHLPVLPENNSYQLWAIYEGVPNNAGLIPSGSKYFAKMENVGKAEAFSITIEPKNGSADPTFENIFATVTIE